MIVATVIVGDGGDDNSGHGDDRGDGGCDDNFDVN